MKIKVIRNFKDWENNLQLRKEGEVYEVTKDRGRYLIDNRFATEEKSKKAAE